ncbi:MAG: integration host factor subunit beta [Candidatus Kapabacteria bacterium]|nr:integration host factor subunit beta [Candidatus Kapabacteria bacterium]MCS7169137.1 integration host factor subunit beta [Candidatus Kapabacteria bacterium]MDW7996470.1 HU family DNA-binding protein [Bacteroidota bacterium]MDW8225510.1 HU family DNA-binding protein [Bacteroidota bacterium]
MRRQDAVRYVSQKTGLESKRVREVMERLLEFIQEHVARGERVDFRGFGSFFPRWRRPRMARNPRTGQPVPLGERRVPDFKPSPKFLQLVQKQQ